MGEGDMLGGWRGLWIRFSNGLLPAISLVDM